MAPWIPDIEVSPLLILCLTAALFFLCPRFLSPRPLDPLEPPEVKATIPIFGHIFGLLWYQAEYWANLSRNSGLPIITARIFGSRIYIIGSTELIQKAISNPKAFTFDTFMAEATRRLGPLDEEGMKHLLVPGTEDGISYLHGITGLMHSNLGPGPSLSQMNARLTMKLTVWFNEIANETTVDLFRWTRDVLTTAVCASLYGFKNPFEDDPSLIDSLWDLEIYINRLVLNFFPHLTARKPYLGRSRLNAAFRAWFSAGLYSQGSLLVQRRRKLALKNGFSKTECADLEFMDAFPAITNAIPVSFWMLSHILADPALAASIHDEVRLCVTTKEVNGVKTAEMDPEALRTQCPLLMSTWEEILRFTVKPTLVRSVTTDTMLNSEYLLKKNAVIQFPIEPNHMSPVWGSSFRSFEPRRFLKSDEKLSRQEKEQRNLQNKAYVPFGGGKHLCPGRHLALNETLSFIGMVLFAFVVERRDGKPFEVIRAQPRALGGATSKPEGDVKVTIRRREEMRGVRLTFATDEDAMGDTGAF